jgi:tetratricopeptide (TPR) repeat protein
MNRIISIFTLTFSLVAFFSISALAQDGWNWPEDPDLFSTAQEKQAFSRVSMQLENYDDAFKALGWLYTNNPNLHESIYIDGAKAIENLITQTEDKEYKQTLRDSLLIVYDLRFENFDNKAEIMGRKAYAAFKQYYNQPARFKLLADLYDTAYALGPDQFAAFNMTPYMTLAKYYYQRKPEEMPATRVLDIHDRISHSIEQQKSSDPDRMKREQDKVDALLSSLGDILTCDFIAEKMVPKLEANPEDLNTAKKIFSYSLKAKCTDQDFFLTAGKLVYDNDPTYQLASALGNKHLAKGETSKAIEYLKKALEMADDPEDQYDAHYSIALAFSKSGNKTASRSSAYQALAIRPGDKKAYNLIGNLYFTSFNDCREGVSKVKDRGVFLAAYKMYQKADNQEQMQACKEQFPSSEEIFNEEMEVGQTFTVGCWIDESVTIQRRD